MTGKKGAPLVGISGKDFQRAGVVEGEPGLYFLGLPFQYTLTSSLIGGVGRDAHYIAGQIAARSSVCVEHTESAAHSRV